MRKGREIIDFRTRLLSWYRQFQRDLPWRRSRDPYRIWVSETMLQQTRVAAVIPYFERFVTRFPDVFSLATAPETDLLTHWAGLGYYYRARNMQKAALQIVALGGFPQSYEGILALPGIGEYTAAAVASIAFDVPRPVVDGNVYRVLSRIFASTTNIASSSARKHFTVLADQVLATGNPGGFNQAVMELGATLCLPKRPQCLICPVSTVCRARSQGRQEQFPVKVKPQKSMQEDRTLFWVEQDGYILLWQRAATARLMPGFWELPERTQLPDADGPLIATFRHGITYHNYRFSVASASAPADLGECQWVEKTELLRMPISTVLKKAYRLVERAIALPRQALPARAS